MEDYNLNIDRFFELAAKLQAEGLSQDEQAEWDQYLNNAEYANQFDALKSTWEQSANYIQNSEQTTFNIDQAWETVKSQTIEEKTSRKSTLSIFAVAASIAVLIGFYFGFMFDAVVEIEHIAENNQTITLPDHSTVEMKKGAILTYASNFKENRELSLKGDAFFEVEKMNGQDFVVHTALLDVSVLGTAFYVSENSKFETEVNVVHGLVEVANISTQKKIKVAKGERALYNDSTQVLEATELDHSTMFWLTNTLVFKKTPLYQVVDILNQQFEKNIQIEDDAIRNCRLTTTFENLELESILEIITSTFNIEVEASNNKIILKGEAC